MAAKKAAEQALVEQWRGILALHARTQGELDRALHGHGLCASDFEVLDVLAQGEMPKGPCSYRVQEISEHIHLSQSALSRLIARLEKDGLVSRGMCQEDRRGVRVALTDKGRALHAEVLPVQRAVLTRMLADDAADADDARDAEEAEGGASAGGSEGRQGARG
ncbi:MarR family winged helix-turn-helix transcriptional regulator [Streptomyces sp. NPDC052773]|uniref:MarR family winged helix-turn-helix transcriptional regulator n=1 Tax=Streptomyces sp. NPDC052773 TaxID=3365693 RepID=UPI0037CDFDBC